MASAAYEYAINNQGIDAMYQAINDFLASNPSPAEVAAAMAQYGVSAEDISNASGYSVQEVNNYVAPAVSAPAPEPTSSQEAYPGRPSPYELSTPAYQEPDYSFEMPAGFDPMEAVVPQLPVYIPPPAPPPTPSAGYTYAQNNQGIDQYYQNISDYVNKVVNDTTLTQQQKADQINSAAKEYGVSNQDIAQALKIDVGQVNNYLAPTTETINVTTPTTTKPVIPSNVASDAAGYVQSQLPKTITDYEGKSYDTSQLAKLALDIEKNLDTARLSGGAFGTSKENIGFDYNTLSSAYGGTQFSTADQIAFDMARSLLSQGITSYDQLKNVKPTTFTEVGSSESGDYTYDRQGYVDPTTGKEVFLNFGQTFTGKGSTTYSIDPTTGKFYTTGHSTSDFSGGLGIVLGAAASFLLPGVGSLIATELGVSQAVGTAIAQAGLQLASGADPKNILLSMAAGPAGFNVSGSINNILSDTISSTQLLNMAANAITTAGTTLIATNGNTNAALLAGAGSVVTATVSNYTGSTAIGAGVGALVASNGNVQNAVTNLVNTAAYNAGLNYKDDVKDLLTGASSSIASTLLNTTTTLLNNGDTQAATDFASTVNNVASTGSAGAVNSLVNNVSNTDFGNQDDFNKILDTFNQGAQVVQDLTTKYGPGYQVAVNNTGDVVVSDAGGGVIQNVGSGNGTETTKPVTKDDLTGTDKQLYDNLENQYQDLVTQREQLYNSGNEQGAAELTPQISQILRQQDALLTSAFDPDAQNTTQFINNHAPIGNPDELLAFQQQYGFSDAQIQNAIATNDLQVQQVLQQQYNDRLQNLEPGQYINGITKDNNSPTGFSNINGEPVNTDGSLVKPIEPTTTPVDTTPEVTITDTRPTGVTPIAPTEPTRPNPIDISLPGPDITEPTNPDEIVITDKRPVPDVLPPVVPPETPDEIVITDKRPVPDVLPPVVPPDNPDEIVITDKRPVPDVLPPTPPVEPDVPEIVIVDKRPEPPVLPPVPPVPPVEPPLPPIVEPPPPPEPPIVEPPVVLPPPIVKPPVTPPVPPVTPPVVPTTPTVNTGGYLNPGWETNVPAFYNTNSPVQSKYYWGPHAVQTGSTFNPTLYNTAPNAPKTPFGLQQIAGNMLNYQQLLDLANGTLPPSQPITQSQYASPVNPQFNQYNSTTPFSMPIVGQQVAKVPYVQSLPYGEYEKTLTQQGYTPTTNGTNTVRYQPFMTYQDYHNMLLNQANAAANVAPVAPVEFVTGGGG